MHKIECGERREARREVSRVTRVDLKLKRRPTAHSARILTQKNRTAIITSSNGMKIYIKSLKSINDGQYIALGKKLTFLVGPNSAGKSTLLLALNRLSGENTNYEFDQSIIHANPNRDDEIAAVSTLGVEWSPVKNNNPPSSTLGFYTSYFLPAAFDKEERDYAFEEIHKLSITTTTDAYEDNFLFKRHSIFENDEFCLGLDNADDPLLFKSYHQGRAVQRTILNLKKVDKNALNNFKAIGSWLIDLKKDLIKKSETIQPTHQYQIDRQKFTLESLKEGSIALEKLLLAGIIYWNPIEVFTNIKLLFKGRELQRTLNIYEKNNALIEKYKKYWLHRIQSTYPGKSFITSLVSAERTLPKSIEINTTIENCIDLYKELITEQVTKEWAIPTAYWPATEETQRNLLTSINKALTENLFIDNGYLVEINTSMLATKKDWDLRNESIEVDLSSKSFNCEIYLRDAHGRKLDFGDVGSGIGYVLPVLIEIFKNSNSGKTVFLQQPELHLHPALQANLTDVLIEASEDRRIVAETHSEHLILRALKRVRQTSAGTLLDKTLQLKPDDIAVNYFEPLSDGSTRVHNLRVSNDGDFIDRWPNGFFAERDKELFDE